MPRRGRGGQRKDKVETAVRVRHEPTGLTVTRSTGRSQAANIASARAQLGKDLAALEDGASRAARNRRRRDQLARSPQARVFTHARGLVTDSVTGQRWDMRAWQQGRLGGDRAGGRPAG